MQINFKSIVLILLILFCSCQKDEDLNPENLEKELNELWIKYENRFPDNNISSAYSGIIIGERLGNLKIKYAYGEAKNGVSATINDQFYTASTGKMLCAATILRLMENGQITLNDKISNYLSDEVMKDLIVFNGVDYSGVITIKQLLDHTSGIPDFLFDDTRRDSSFLDICIASNLEKIWTPEETIEFSKKYTEPIGKPGKKHYYSDTGYNLLGLIIKNITGKEYAEAVREYIFSPLDMDMSFAPFYEAPVTNNYGGVWSDAYFYDNKSGTNFNMTEHYNVFSFEYGGGNWVSSIDDTYKFLKALTDGSIFNNIDTRNLMLTEKVKVMNSLLSDIWYGYGIYIADNEHGKNYGHPGATNSWAFYIPRYDTYIIGSFNQVNTNGIEYDKYNNEVLAILEKYHNR